MSGERDPKQDDARQAPEMQLYLGMDEKFPNQGVIIDNLLLWLECAFVLSVSVEFVRSLR